MLKVFSFEVKETDLMGRIGALTVGKRRVETPCLLPVIHPVKRDTPLPLFGKLGFNALMTNSFIIFRRRREEALEKGIHTMLGFDGVLMTDSGGYQVLEYGEVDTDPIAIARFQSQIGSDLAVTLDKPTGYSRSPRYARETVEVSLRGALDTIRKLGQSKTTWVGPIQGGLFEALVSRSARRLVGAGFEMVALGSPTQIMEGYLFSDLGKMIIAAKRSIPYSMPLHLFGAGHTLTLPLIIALGCDTFDSASYILFAKQGRYMTERGTLELRRMEYLPCSCEICVSTSCRDLKEMTREERTNKIAVHNLYALREELLKCKQALAEGRLWDLVVERAESHPSLKAALSEFSRHGALLREGTPILKERGLAVRGDLDLMRPELEIARQHLPGVMKRRALMAALISADDDKPLTRLKVYQGLVSRFGDKRLDVYRTHPELGAYPAELEFVYPFGQTTRPVKRKSRRVVTESVRRLKSLGYRRIFLCDGDRLKRAFR